MQRRWTIDQYDVYFLMKVNADNKIPISHGSLGDVYEEEWKFINVMEEAQNAKRISIIEDINDAKHLWIRIDPKEEKEYSVTFIPTDFDKVKKFLMKEYNHKVKQRCDDNECELKQAIEKSEDADGVIKIVDISQPTEQYLTHFTSWQSRQQVLNEELMLIEDHYKKCLKEYLEDTCFFLENVNKYSIYLRLKAGERITEKDIISLDRICKNWEIILLKDKTIGALLTLKTVGKK